MTTTTTTTGELTPEARAERFFRLTLVYQQWTGTREDEETVATDMLADLMHYADEYGFDFDRVCVRARMHYEAEVTS